MRYTWLQFEPWKTVVLVLVGGTEDEVNAYIKERMDIDFETIGASAKMLFVPGKGWVLWFSELRTTWVVHESFHLVMSMLRHRGLKFSDKSDEAYAYTIEMIVGKILDADWTKIPKKSKRRKLAAKDR